LPSSTPLVLPDTTELRTLRHYLRHALAAYGHVRLRVLGILPPASQSSPLGQASGWTDVSALQTLTGVGEADILVASWSSRAFTPGHLLVADHASRAVVLAFRGSSSIHDILTDLVCEHAHFEDALGRSGEAHAGMLKAARRLLHTLRPSIDSALRSYEGYSFVLAGHSLGAGLAALMALEIGPIWRVDSKDVPVQAFAYASPAVVSLNLSQACAAFVTSIIVEADLVPRVGITTVLDLRESLRRLHDEVGLKERIAARWQSAAAAGATLPAPTPGAPAQAACEEVLWARSLLRWLQHEASEDRPSKLYPPGRVLWKPAALGDRSSSGCRTPAVEPASRLGVSLCEDEDGRESAIGKDGGACQGTPSKAINMEWIAVDAAEFSTLLLCGSQMVTAHLPSSYASALGLQQFT
jgi:pimeloyl-ACP methyl ester carboxylesterase